MERKELIEIILKLKDANLFTNSKTHKKVIKRFIEENEDLVLMIATNGLPPGLHHCRECKENLPADQFSYYQTRVTGEGYLQRSNALCHDCASKINKERQQVFKKNEDAIPDKPRPGTRCPSCDRAWAKEWHRHHEGDKFIEWLCSNCNMALHDQRNKKKNEK